MHEAPDTLTYESRLIPAMLENAALKFPKRDAIVFFGSTMTYKQLWEAVNQFSQALQETGVREKERIILFLPNCPHFVIAYYAALSVGAVVVPSNPLYSEKELEFQINDSGSTTLVTLDALFPKVRETASGTQLKRTIVGRVQDYLPKLKKLIYPILPEKENS